MLKRLAVGLSAMIGLGVLGGCGNQQSTQAAKGPISITYWASMGGADSQAMQKMVRSFNTSQHKYKLDAQFITSDYYKKVDLTVANSMRGMPDVMIMHSDELANYASRGVLAPTSILGKSKLLVKSKYSAKAWKAGDYKGKHYMIPLDIHGPVLFYNKTLFKKAGLDPNRPPKTYKEFLADAKKLTHGDQYGFVMSTDFINEFMVESMVEQHGSSFFTKAGVPNFNTKVMKDVLNLEHDLIYKDHIAPTTDFDTVGNFLRGKVGMIFNGPWTAPTFEQTDMKWGMGEFPQFFPEKNVVICKSQQFAMPSTLKDPKKIAGVKAFLEFMNQHSMAWSDAGQAPASKAVYESKAFQKLPQVAMSDQFSRAAFTPQIDGVGLYSQMLYAQISDILLNRQTVSKGIKQAQSDAYGMYKAEHLSKQ